MTDVSKTLAERGARYGKFDQHAIIAQGLRDLMRATDGWARCATDAKQALETIADKVARILNGDPEYADNWHDIAGYASLVDQRINKTGIYVDVTVAPPGAPYASLDKTAAPIHASVGALFNVTPDGRVVSPPTFVTSAGAAYAALDKPAAPVHASADDWIEWNGGECPVPHATHVEIQYRNSDWAPFRAYARNLRWVHTDANCDIVAYRVVPADSSKTEK